jgi:hypothetical protein
MAPTLRHEKPVEYDRGSAQFPEQRGSLGSKEEMSERCDQRQWRVLGARYGGHNVIGCRAGTM